MKHVIHRQLAFACAIVLGLGFACGAQAQGSAGDPGSASARREEHNARRDARQEHRIQQGIANGSLTRREAARLQAREARLHRVEARAGADGRIGWREQRHIDRMQDRDSRAIWRQKHDRQHRWRR